MFPQQEVRWVRGKLNEILYGEIINTFIPKASER